MRILVYGAGPMGSLFASHLQWAGHDVSILARNRRLADLREHGIVLEDHITGEQTVTRVHTVETFGPEDDDDLVMVIMRMNQAVEILPTLAANDRVNTFLFLMNSIEGPGRLVDALGEDRVMMGFPYPGGYQDGPVTRVVTADEKNRWILPIGEAGGRVTQRTRAVAAALQKMPAYKVQVRRDMDRWLKYHVALMIPGLSPALYAANTDVRRMARTRDAVVLAVRGMKEALRSLRRVGYPESPGILRVIHWLPEPLLILRFERLLKTQMMKTSGEGHLKAAPDEMRYLIDGFFELVHDAGIETPICDRLYAYYDPETPPIPDGSSDIPVNWTGVWALLLAVGAIIVALVLSDQD